MQSRLGYIFIILFVFLSACGIQNIEVNTLKAASHREMRDLASVEKPELTEERINEMVREAWLEQLEINHKEIIADGNIFTVRNITELNLLMANTKYLTITFYNNYCFAQTQASYNMVHNQPDMLKRIPDMVFVNIHIDQFPELLEPFQVSGTPFTVLVDRGQAKAGSPGYYDNEGLEKFIRDNIEI